MSSIALSNNLWSTAVGTSNQAFTNRGGSGGSVVAYPLFRNKIINPDLAIDQRNVGQAQLIGTDGTFYGPDRLIASINTGASGFQYNLQQQILTNADVTTTGGIHNSCRMTTNSNVTFSATTKNVGFAHVIEGNFIPDLYWGNASGTSASFSMWIKTNVTGTHHVSFQNSACNASYVKTFSVSSANSWTKVSATIPSPSNGTWLTDSNAGVIIKIDDMCDNLKTASTGAWLSGNYSCPTAYNSNLWQVANNYLEITGLQFEKGTTNTPFEFRPPAFELALCQRYFEKSFNASSLPQNNTMGVAPGSVVYLQGQYGTGEIYFKQTKRSIPSLTFYNPWNSNGVAFNTDTSYTSTTLTAQSPNGNGFSVSSSDTSLQNGPATFNWTASAEF